MKQNRRLKRIQSDIEKSPRYRWFEYTNDLIESICKFSSDPETERERMREERGYWSRILTPQEEERSSQIINAQLSKLSERKKPYGMQGKE